MKKRDRLKPKKKRKYRQGLNGPALVVYPWQLETVKGWFKDAQRVQD